MTFPPCNERCRQHLAFSLAELLATVAILAVLSALLFPALGRVMEKGRQAACQSNLHQLGLGLLAYAQDNEGKLPQSHLSTYPGSGTFANDILFLVQDVNPYLGMQKSTPRWGQAYPNPNATWKCPVDSAKDGIGFEGKWHGSSYTYQWQYGGTRILAPMTSGYERWYPSWTWILKPVPLSEAPLLWDYSLNHESSTHRNVLFADLHLEYVNATWTQPLKNP